MHRNEVVGVHLGLLPGEQLLACILAHRRNHAGRDFGARLWMRKGRLRRKHDLLQLELIVDVRVRKAIPPHCEPTRDQQDDNDQHATGADQLIKNLSSHHSLPCVIASLNCG